MKSILKLQKRALALRINSVRATTAAESGHPTSCLSAADIMAVLFFHTMHIDIEHYDNPCNDRFILSKGHAAPLLYAAWKELGKLSDSQLLTLRQFNSPLEGHPTARFPYNEAATGSLGQGLSIGVGMALAAHINQLTYRTFVLLGDSEMTEGSNWEAAEIASFYKLNNLIAIVDINHLGQRGTTSDALQGDPQKRLAQKFDAFGWKTYLVDGHNINDLVKTMDQITKHPVQQPIALLASTIKGYGLNADIENNNGFHGKALSRERLDFYLKNLNQRFLEDTHHKAPLLSLPPFVPIKPFCKPSTAPLPIKNTPQATYKKGEKIATRKAYGQALADSGEDTRIICLDAEVKNSTYAELFEKKFPDRFIECFVAEQNMIGMAVGLAQRGMIPFASTFASFLTRAYDQIRMAGIGRVPLRLVGSHAGVSIGHDGPSQMGLEDIAMMRTIPESIILYPSDAISTAACVKLMHNYNQGISYLRTTRAETPILYSSSTSFILGGCHILKKSTHDSLCIIASGITVFEALKAYEILKKENIKVRIIDCYCIKPLPVKTIKKSLEECNGILITIEDHYQAGGLGEALLSTLSTFIKKAECLSVTQLPQSGTPEDLLAFEGIDANALIKAVKRLI